MAYRAPASSQTLPSILSTRTCPLKIASKERFEPHALGCSGPASDSTIPPTASAWRVPQPHVYSACSQSTQKPWPSTPSSKAGTHPPFHSHQPWPVASAPCMTA